MARLAGVCILAVLVLAAGASAAIYPGTSQAFKPAKKPVAALLKGYKNGVVALYAKGTTKAPVNALATVYVYSSTAAARLAWKHACSKCTTQAAPQGLKVKAEAGTSNGQPTLHTVSTCGNVYLDVIEQGSQSALKIDTDVAKITNAVLTRAIHGGLSSCSAK